MSTQLPLVKHAVVRSVMVPFRLAPRSASGALSHAALVLIDLNTNAGVTGRSYLFAIAPSLLEPLAKTVAALAAMIADEPLSPQTVSDGLRQRLTLVDTPGTVGLALAGLDMALWDAHAQFHQVPLAQLLGASVDRVKCYNSCGLWIQDPDGIGAEAESLLDGGRFEAMKIRIGRANPADDVRAVDNVLSVLGSGATLMSDFNQSQSVASAIQRGRMLDDKGLYWIEEPVRHADYRGTAAVRQALNTPIQTGENLCSDHDLLTAIQAGCADYYMPDVQRIGGVTGWQRAAALCHAGGLGMSSHLFPEISVHLLAATPTAHWLEYVDWANPILADPVVIEDGHALVPERPGTGISWDEAAVQKFLI